VTVSGIAQTNERVSEFLRNISRSSEWLEKPDLIEVKLANVSPTRAMCAACSTSR
jgi:type IV pilus assembly protein PilN